MFFHLFVRQNSVDISRSPQVLTGPVSFDTSFEALYPFVAQVYDYQWAIIC